MIAFKEQLQILISIRQTNVSLQALIIKQSVCLILELNRLFSITKHIMTQWTHFHSILKERIWYLCQLIVK